MDRDSEGKDTKPERRRLNVLVAVDGSSLTDLVLKRSGQFYAVTDCELTLLTVAEHMLPVEHIPASAYGQERQKIAEEILQRAEKTLKDHGIECKTRLAFGPIEERIVRIAEEGEHDIVFIGSRGLGGISRMLLGSVAENVLRHAHCSVMLVR